MINQLSHALEIIIERATGKHASIENKSNVGGGCINQACVVMLSDGRKFFVKYNPMPLPEMFPREAEGLNALAESGAIRVPSTLGTGGELDNEFSNTVPFIVMEYIPSGRQSRDFSENFGRRLAELHQKTNSKRFGFWHNNYIGSTPQPNGWKKNWVEFWREHRLGYQLELAKRRGLSTGHMNQLGKQLVDHLDDLISEPNEPACLLHGDLWSGNYMCGKDGEPVLIDPAAYYGRREADLAMTLLFGGFDDRFYRAYEKVWPLANGSTTRLDLYKLYHLLNHLNLFGSSYYPSCMAILQRYA